MAEETPTTESNFLSDPRDATYVKDDGTIHEIRVYRPGRAPFRVISVNDEPLYEVRDGAVICLDCGTVVTGSWLVHRCSA